MEPVSTVFNTSFRCTTSCVPMIGQFLQFMSSTSIGTLKIQRGDGNENVKKGLISKTITSRVHRTFLYISFAVFAVLRRENVKMFRVLWRT